MHKLEMWGEKTVIAMYTCKDNLTPLLYSGKIKKKKKKKCVSPYIFTNQRHPDNQNPEERPSLVSTLNAFLSLSLFF